MLRIYFNVCLFCAQITSWNHLLLSPYFTYVLIVHAKCYIQPVMCLLLSYKIIIYKYNTISIYKRTMYGAQ